MFFILFRCTKLDVLPNYFNYIELAKYKVLLIEGS